MAILDSNYRVHLDITYSNTTNANTASGNINNALSSIGRPETCSVAGTHVTLLIVGISTEDEAVVIRDNIRSAWSGSTRTSGKVGIARSNN